MTETRTLRRFGIDRRLLLLIPLSTILCVLFMAAIMTIPSMLVSPGTGPLLAMLFLTGVGLVQAVSAWPLSLPLALSGWGAVFGFLKGRGLNDRTTATVAAGAAGFCGAAGFAIWMAWVAPSDRTVAMAVFAGILPAVLVGSVFAARVIYRGKGAAA
jgi:hypothetical protein